MSSQHTDKIRAAAAALVMLLLPAALLAQNPGEGRTVRLGLQRAIEIASDSSLASFRFRNLYMAGFWEYRSFRANRLPSLNLNLTPARYYRDITSRYDYENNIDVYRAQQSYYASAGLDIRQNLDRLFRYGWHPVAE